jgi:Mg2+ and Co2+ transporter CorA
MENFRKKKETEIKNTTEGCSSSLEQAEDRISELEDKMEIKGKTDVLLFKQLKTCERNMQELTNSIKSLNLRMPHSWVLKKEKGWKQKEFVIHSTK